MSAQIEVTLKWKKDKLGKKYLWGDIDLPATLDLSNLMIFIWPNSEESEDVPVMVLRKRDERDSKDSKDKKDDEVWVNH